MPVALVVAVHEVVVEHRHTRVPGGVRSVVDEFPVPGDLPDPPLFIGVQGMPDQLDLGVDPLELPQLRNLLPDEDAVRAVTAQEDVDRAGRLGGVELRQGVPQGTLQAPIPVELKLVEDLPGRVNSIGV